MIISATRCDALVQQCVENLLTQLCKAPRLQHPFSAWKSILRVAAGRQAGGSFFLMWFLAFGEAL